MFTASKYIPHYTHNGRQSTAASQIIMQMASQSRSNRCFDWGACGRQQLPRVDPRARARARARRAMSAPFPMRGDLEHRVVLVVTVDHCRYASLPFEHTPPG